MTTIAILAAFDWSAIWWWISVILKVSIGLGAVIFVHELGHFVVAKLCGVKCEKFMIGFDIGGYKLSWRRGETLYGIGILPLGGYVKMLGQDDDPAHIKEQMEKSQIDAQSANAKAIKGPDGETYYVDRRSYLAKSVPQRMAIISAGVVMNIIFAFIFAAIAYGMGVPYTPAIVGETVPAVPAWQAGLEPGDEIVKIGDRTDPTFVNLIGDVTLGDMNGITCIVRRAANNEPTTITLKAKQKKGEVPMIGITNARSLELSTFQPTIDNSAAAAAKLITPTQGTAKEDTPRFHKRDKIVRVGDVPVTSYREFAAQLARQPDKPLQITVERIIDQPEVDSQANPAETREARLTFEVPTQPLRDFGLVMKMGPITAVQTKSPGEAAGLMVGDQIETVDGKSAGAGSWTPETLPNLMREAAEENRAVDLGVLRGATGGGREIVGVKVTPRLPSMYYSYYPSVPLGAPQGVEALGIAYQVTNAVQAVVPGGTAANSNIKSGDTLTAAKIVFPQDEKGETPKPLELKLGDDAPNWVALVDAIQFAPKETTVEFTVIGDGEKDSRDVKIAPAPTKVYNPVRGFLFMPVKRVRTATTLVEQMRYGWDETVDALTMVVRFLRKLGGQVPFSMLGGPGTIAAAAGASASQGISSLLVFLTMLSANLAVLNFLPIPLLDGGHFVFLAYEGIRGRPANEKFVIALHTLGFVFIVGLMLFVIGLDIKRWVFTSW